MSQYFLHSIPIPQEISNCIVSKYLLIPHIFKQWALNILVSIFIWTTNLSFEKKNACIEIIFTSLLNNHIYLLKNVYDC